MKNSLLIYWCLWSYRNVFFFYFSH